jgi:hypothetical protein
VEEEKKEDIEEEDEMESPLKINVSKYLMEERRQALLDFAKSKMDDEMDYGVFHAMV